MTRKLALSLMVASVAALGVFTARVHAIDDPGSRLTSGPVGTTRFETIRLNRVM